MEEKVKISKGLNRLLKNNSKATQSQFTDEFVINPENRHSYLQSFNNALVVEIANNDY
ncbi:MAG: hypothetical protein ACJAZM_000491 [Cyclobacteriaceae bacterium]|jgi:hypothetical protein